MNNAHAPQSYSTQDEQSEQPKGMTVKASKAKKAPSAFRTISEVADELDVQQHVLRFWETKFSQIRPLKRGGGRRYYRPEDIALLKRIHHLLYTEGYTIKGVQKLLRGQGKAQVLAEAKAEPRTAPSVVPTELAQKPEVKAEVALAPSAPKKGMSDNQRALMQGMLDDLKDLRDILKG